MKNRWMGLAVVMLPVLLTSCGRKETPEPAMAEDAAGFSAAESVPLDPPVPRDLPPCPGLLAVENIQGDEQSGSVLLFSAQSAPAALDFYTAALAEDGWILGSSLAQGPDQHLQFNRNGRLLRFQIGPGGAAGTTRILMAWHQPAGAGAAAQDAYAPDPMEQEPDNFREQSVEW